MKKQQFELICRCKHLSPLPVRERTIALGMTENTMHKIGRIDQIVRDFFETNGSVEMVLARDLMDLFIKKGIFKKDHRNGLPLRNLLREIDAENKLSLIKNLKVERRDISRNWYFIRK